ncbi:response regulator [Rhodoplanes sp. TEM]|uniref:Response regulator n=1 Tax=Rhodoplanes tepidamans TaxID=200616 RepID=A0ABT5J8R4_RHOTP|nr:MULTISPECIES: response regulator [Rhodoplanes]MDC7786046.1 response regulator [Rhodoplanes tepidamans]MDC7983813.1 response regulator [Rhodoplanes sp. TEM]MDQ0354889.1 FixJ family two-component response regulator [Rhodoplanes tepidamans]
MTRNGRNELSLPTIVVVNDDPGLRHALRFALGVEGFAVRTFARGAELLDAPDLPDLACVVTEARLPDMAGLDLVARLRRRRARLPAILITSDPSLRLRREAEDAGVPLIEQPLRGDSVVNGVLALLTGRGGTDPRGRHAKA